MLLSDNIARLNLPVFRCIGRLSTTWKCYVVRASLICGCAVSACNQSPPSSVGAASAVASANSANPVTNAPTVVFLGDSLTAGLGLEEKDALPALIQQRLLETGHSQRVINAGRSGDTSAGGLSRLGWYLRDDVNLSMLIVGLGSNDAMRGLPVPALEENLRAIIRQTRATRPNVVILLWQLHTFPNLGSEYAEQYAAVFPRVAEAERVQLIPFPLSQVAGNAELNQADGIHPTREGTRLVADQVWKSMEGSL
jgi:acyl-CoA thioesterase I